MGAPMPLCHPGCASGRTVHCWGFMGLGVLIIWGQSAPTAEGYLPDQSIATEPAIK